MSIPSQVVSISAGLNGRLHTSDGQPPQVFHRLLPLFYAIQDSTCQSSATNLSLGARNIQFPSITTRYSASHSSDDDRSLVVIFLFLFFENNYCVEQQIVDTNLVHYIRFPLYSRRQENCSDSRTQVTSIAFQCSHEICGSTLKYPIDT